MTTATRDRPPPSWYHNHEHVDYSQTVNLLSTRIDLGEDLLSDRLKARLAHLARALLLDAPISIIPPLTPLAISLYVPDLSLAGIVWMTVDSIEFACLIGERLARFHDVTVRVFEGGLPIRAFAWQDFSPGRAYAGPSAYWDAAFGHRSHLTEDWAFIDSFFEEP
jgi:hypothetical protein